MNGEGFAYRTWRMGLSRQFVITLFGRSRSDVEAILRQAWANLQLRKLAVRR